jgi:hypothetical protein
MMVRIHVNIAEHLAIPSRFAKNYMVNQQIKSKFENSSKESYEKDKAAVMMIACTKEDTDYFIV